MAKRRTHGKNVAGTRLPVPYKEYNKTKNVLEKHIVAAGGSFEDRPINSAVRSTYKLGSKSRSYTWHFTPSQGSIHITKKQIFGILDEIGVLSKLGLDKHNKSQARQRMRLAKTIDGKSAPSTPVNEYPKELADLVRAIDIFMSKSAAEYQADIINENPTWDRMIRYYY